MSFADGFLLIGAFIDSWAWWAWLGVGVIVGYGLKSMLVDGEQ